MTRDWDNPRPARAQQNFEGEWMTKTALVDISTAVLEDALSHLRNAGLSIVGSEKSPAYLYDTIRLVIQGDALPDECGSALLVVQPWFATQQKGDQRLTRLTQINVIGAA